MQGDFSHSHILRIWEGMALFEGCHVADAINIKILNAGAWARTSERVSVTLPMELEDYIPQVEEFYRIKHSGRKLQWHHLMSNGIVSNLSASLFLCSCCVWDGLGVVRFCVCG